MKDPANARVWHWSDFASWQGEIRELLSDVLTKRVYARFHASPPEYPACDELEWLDAIIESQTRVVSDIKVLLASRLPTRYDAIRAFHGARPVDPARYRTQGLRTLDTNEKLQDLVRLFDANGLGVSPEQLAAATAAILPDGRAGRLYFEANAAHLLRDCGHYMLYGSEFLIAIAAHISEQHRAFLRTIGTPTVFVCDVPLALVSPYQLEAYAGMALEAIFLAELGTPKDLGHEHQPSGLVIRTDLPPHCIREHFHPTRLFDPFRQSWWVAAV